MRTIPLLCLGLVLGGSSLRAEEPAKQAEKPKVEVVFVLDTTGSMSGLIEAAKQKIWSISNQIVSAKPTPDVKIGLVGYRDRTDEYITKIHELDADLDEVYKNLRKFSAAGGGDGPESVNQALAEAVDKIKWSKDKKTLKIIFLVGDAPPHMDYKDDVKYPVTCKNAVKKDLIINTIQCGSDANTTKTWKDICAKAEGSYARIAQSGGVVAVKTPFDKRLAEINTELAGSIVVFGDDKTRAEGESKKGDAKALDAPAAAERAAYYAKARKGAEYDLLEAIKGKKVKLEDLKEKQLPEKLRKMNLAQRKEYLADLDKKREKLQKEARDLDEKRGKYIAEELKKKGDKAKDAFDNQVLTILRDQAKKKGLKYEK